MCSRKKAPEGERIQTVGAGAMLWPHLGTFLSVVVNVVDLDRSAGYFGAAQVVYRQHCAALIFIRKEGKATRVAGVLVPGQQSVSPVEIHC